MGGLNLGVLSNLHALNIFKQVQRIDQKYYPEMLSVTYIVNAGWAFRAVWNVLKVVFPARDHGKEGIEDAQGGHPGGAHSQVSGREEQVRDERLPAEDDGRPQGNTNALQPQRRQDGHLHPEVDQGVVRQPEEKAAARVHGVRDGDGAKSDHGFLKLTAFKTTSSTLF